MAEGVFSKPHLRVRGSGAGDEFFCRHCGESEKAPGGYGDDEYAVAAFKFGRKHTGCTKGKGSAK